MERTKDGGHIDYVCPGEHDHAHCMFCDGGLSSCSVCDAFEGAWPDECPGERMTYEQLDAVYAGDLNFRAGQWRDGECCRVQRPAEEVLIEDGYVRGDDGRWSKPDTSIPRPAGYPT